MCKCDQTKKIGFFDKFFKRFRIMKTGDGKYIAQIHQYGFTWEGISKNSWEYWSKFEYQRKYCAVDTLEDTEIIISKEHKAANVICYPICYPE